MYEGIRRAETSKSLDHASMKQGHTGQGLHRLYSRQKISTAINDT